MYMHVCIHVCIYTFTHIFRFICVDILEGRRRLQIRKTIDLIKLYYYR